MKQEGVENEYGWQELIKKIRNEPMSGWERLELSLCCPLVDVSKFEIEPFLEQFLSYVKDKNVDKTIVHVHVPKAAGTSVNKAFLNKFYHEGIALPGNNTPFALRYIFENYMGSVPFLTTSHVALDWLISNEVKVQSCDPFMVHRPHKDRINSMRNQIVSSLLNSKFLNRPYSYYKQFYIGEMLNKYLFPVFNEKLISTMSSSLSDDIDKAADIIEARDVSIVAFDAVHDYLKEEYDITLLHGKKNRTYNLSKYMLEIPEFFYAADSKVFR